MINGGGGGGVTPKEGLFLKWGRVFTPHELWPMYQNDLWLRFIRTLIFLSNFKFLIRSVVIFNMKVFCEHKMMKKIKKVKTTIDVKV